MIFHNFLEKSKELKRIEKWSKFLTNMLYMFWRKSKELNHFLEFWIILLLLLLFSETFFSHWVSNSMIIPSGPILFYACFIIIIIIIIISERFFRHWVSNSMIILYMFWKKPRSGEACFSNFMIFHNF